VTLIGRAALLCALAGCGGGTAARDGAAGSTGAGGVATGGAGGTTGGAAGGNSGGLPACPIATRPNDPTNPEGGNPIDSSTPICNTVAMDGAWVTDECFEMVDGGWQQDGGPALVVPEGGAFLDGDYDLVRYQVNFSGQPCAPGPSTGSVNRRIRVFDGGRYVEWAATNRDANGTDTNYWYDTTVSAAGHTLSIVEICAAVPLPRSYGYTASGDDFTYFRFSNEDGTGGLTNVVTYRRTCRR
jgi:hypothetical protein